MSASDLSANNLDVLGNLNVTNQSVFNNDIKLNNRLFAERDVFLFRDITTSANITTNNLVATGFISGNYQSNSIPPTAIIGGVGSGSGNVNFTNDISMNKRLFVNGDVSFNKALLLAGDASLNSKLLVIADRYWRIDLCPNLKCKLEIPKIIFSSFSILI